ncbi:MAG: hypothetical protein WA440_05735 [Ignavibacteriaceae bacterium]
MVDFLMRMLMFACVLSTVRERVCRGGRSEFPERFCKDETT